MSLRQNGCAYIELNRPEEVLLYCMYERDFGRTYKIYSGEEAASTIATQITMCWGSNLPSGNIFGGTDLADGLILAKGLLHLDLLTPEAEVALNASIFTRQKLEWTLEFLRRLEQDK